MAKRVELLREITPRAKVFAALINPKNPAAAISAKEVQDAARALAKDIHIVHASNESELEPNFATLSQLRTGALLIAPDGLFIIHADRVAALSARCVPCCMTSGIKNHLDGVVRGSEEETLAIADTSA